MYIQELNKCLCCCSTRSTCTQTFYNFSFQICTKLGYSSELVQFSSSPDLSFVSLRLSKVKPTCIISPGCGCYWNLFYKYSIRAVPNTSLCILYHMFVLHFLQLVIPVYDSMIFELILLYLRISFSNSSLEFTVRNPFLFHALWTA